MKHPILNGSLSRNDSYPENLKHYKTFTCPKFGYTKGFSKKIINTTAMDVVKFVRNLN